MVLPDLINGWLYDAANKLQCFQYVPGELGKQQLEGEYIGMSALYEVAPHFVPQAIAWGKLESVYPTSYFLLVEFKEFAPTLPNATKLGQRVAEMHMNPKSVSPTGMFGFHIQTFDGARLQSIAWDPSWTSFFSKLLAEAYRQDAEVNGLWPEMDFLYRNVQSYLIPRLIGALESEGRSVTPVLIHCDMWDGNVGTDSSTGDPWIFDCAAYYAHNEMELGIWRAERHKLHEKQYRDAYLQLVDPSEPEEEFEDRILLYSAKTNFMNSACIWKSEARHQ